jgi:fibronectin-binding autotransporter adhesin
LPKSKTIRATRRKALKILKTIKTGKGWVINNFYRSVWNEAIGAWVAVSEIASIRGKRSSGLRRAGGHGDGTALERPDPDRTAFSLRPVCAALRALRMAGLVSALMLLSPSAHADDVTWTGGNTNQNWPVAAHWDTGATPGSNDVAVLDGGAGGASASLTSFGIIVGGVELRDNAVLNLTNRSSVNVRGNINIGTAVNGMSTVLNAVDSFINTVDLSVGVAAGSSGAINVSGPNMEMDVTGTAIIGGDGAGSMTISGNGMVVVGSDGTGGAADGSGVLNVGTDGGGTGTLNMGDATGDGILRASGVALRNGTSSIVFDGSANRSFVPVISGSGFIVKNGSGTLELDAVNTYSGGTQLFVGDVSVGNNSGLGTGLVTFNGAATLSTNTAVTLANDVQLVNADAGFISNGAITLNGVVSGANGFGLTKDGFGSLTLTGNNTYTGVTSLNDGTLIVGSDTALGTGVLHAANGTVLDASAAVALANNITFSSSLTIGGTNALTLNGNISGGNVGLIKNGNASLTVTGNNTYIGDTELNSGTLILGSNAPLGTPPAPIMLGTGSLIAGDGTTLDANTAMILNNRVSLSGVLTIGGSADLTLDGPVDGTGALVKDGAANLTLNNVFLNNGTSGFTGGVTLTAGTLTLGINGAMGAGPLIVSGASTLDNNVALNAVANGLTLVSNLSIAGSNDLTLTGIIHGLRGLIKNGSANLELDGVNSFQGGVTLNAGELTLGNAGAMGTGALIVGNTSTLGNTATLTLTNDVTLNADLSIAASTSDLTLGGTIDGTGGLIKNGSQDLALSGNNIFTGALTINAGSVTTISDGALGNASVVSIGAGARLNVDSNAGVNGLAGNGAVQIASGQTFTVGAGNASSSFDGGMAGAGAFTKDGSGTLTLTGINGITGNTMVTGGTLNVTGSLGSAAVTVGNGATLGGNGSLLGALTVDSGGHLNLGSGNTLSVGSLVMNNTTNLDVALGAPSTNSLLNIGGSLTLDGRLNASDAGNFGVGIYRLIDYTGALTDNDLDVTTAPVGYNTADLQVQTSVANQVNLLVSASTSNVRFWDGSQSSANGAIGGGAGTWDAGSTNWTLVDGSQNQAWNSDFAVFEGTAGDITVNGTQSLNGMQFVTDGYRLLAGAAAQLTIVNAGSGNTSVRVDPGSTATIDVNIDGSGTLNKLDNGTLVLNGVNTYTGGTLLSGGALVVGDDSALGSGVVTAAAGTVLASNTNVNLHNDFDLAGDLTIDGNQTLSLDGVIDGTGGLIKNGSGKLILSGADTYSGVTSINAGMLSVNGSIASAVTVNSGGTLFGIGSIGGLNVMSGGVVAPGNNSGAMTVNGNATFAGGSSYRVAVDAAGHTDRIDVTGNVALNGTVDVQAGAGTYADNTSYIILTNTGTQSGTFADVTSNMAFLTPTLSYSANKVVLNMARNETTFSSVAATSNQHAISSTLDNVPPSVGGDMRTVLTAVASLSAEQAHGAYDAMSGVGLNTMQRAAPAFTNNFGNQLRSRLNVAGASASASASANSFNTIQLAANDHIDDLMPMLAQGQSQEQKFTLGGDGIPQMPAATDNRGFWLRAYGTDQSTRSDGNAAGNRIQDTGLSAGIDVKVNDNFVIGAALTHGSANIDTDNNESGHTSGNAAALYASYAAGAWNFNGSATLARNGNSMDRRIVFGAIDRTAHSDFDSNTVALYGDVTYDLAMAGGWTLQPLAGLSLSRSKADGFSETGADALNLQVAEQTVHSTKTLLGSKAIFDFDKVELQPRLIWEHEFGDANSATTAQLQGAPTPFSTTGVHLPRDAVVAGMTLVGHASEQLSLFADVQGEFNSQQSNLALLVGLRASW